jgi:dihydropyrimidinase
MGKLDVLVRGGLVVSPSATFRADVAIADGKIVGVGDGDWGDAATRVIDASGLHVLPGVIDPHVHMTSAGKTVEQSCLEETPSMVAGGVTSCVHFAQSYDSYVPVLERDRDAVNRSSLIDVAFHAMLMREVHLQELARYHSEFGVMSYKIFFAAGGEELYPGTSAVDDGFLYRAFRAVAQLEGCIAMAHCENWEVANALADELRREGRTDAAAWSDSRPAFCEEDGIRRALFWAGVTDCPLYIVHCSSRSAPRLVGEAKAAGIDVTGETCPHYLTVHRDHPDALVAKYNPAIKHQSDMDGLWEGLRDGLLSTMGSDHIPVRARDKDLEGKDVWSARGGLPGSGTILPVLLSEGVNKGRISIERVVEVCSHAPARTFGLAGRKGTIAPGADADLVLVDLGRRVTVRPEMLQLDVVLFDGWEFTGWPTLTMVRGQVVMEDGEITAAHGVGRYLRDTNA